MSRTPFGLVALALTALITACAPPAELAQLAVTVESPPVAVGAAGELVVEVRNTGGEPLVITDIDVAKSLLAGVEVARVDPAPERDDLELLDCRIFRFNHRLAPRSTWRVTWHLIGARDGTYAGDVDVGLDPFRTLTTPVREFRVGSGEAPERAAGTPSVSVSPPATPPAAPSEREADSPLGPAPPTADRPAPRP